MRNWISASSIAKPALLLLVGAASLHGEPKDGTSNDFGRWRRAEPGDFVPNNEPAYTTAEQAKLDPEAKVIGVVVNGDARAYPLRLITYHHVVNDTIGDEPLSVTYCGMANSAVVYRREKGMGNLEAGALFGGSLAMREQGTANCWAQIAPVALPEDSPTTRSLSLGPPSVITTWERWRAAHPETKVLSPVLKYEMRYEAYDHKQPGFVANVKMNETITNHDARLEPGTEIYGLSRKNDVWACTLEELKKAGEMTALIDGKSVVIMWDKQLDAPRVKGDFDGYAMRAYWYAWSQTHPKTRLEK